MIDLSPIEDFLACPTPQAWLDEALQQPQILLVDHANCEKKAASTAMNLIYKYIDKPDLLHKLSRLAREELRHFEQVLSFMQKRDIEYIPVSASRYAGGLRDLVRKTEPYKLIDTLICGAFIEARSCERFARLYPLLDEELGQFYEGLLRSESRHFQDYLKLAAKYAGEPIDERIAVFREKEAELVQSEDPEFRFHSGIPAAA